MNRFINGKNILKFIKAQRIRWLGHVERKEVGTMQRKMMEDCSKAEEEEDPV